MKPEFKTGKRETALGLLGGWVAISLYLFFGASTEAVQNYEGIYGTMTGLVTVVVTGLFAIKGGEVAFDRHSRRSTNPRLSGEGEHEHAG